MPREMADSCGRSATTSWMSWGTLNRGYKQATPERDPLSGVSSFFQARFRLLWRDTVARPPVTGSPGPAPGEEGKTEGAGGVWFAWFMWFGRSPKESKTVQRQDSGAETASLLAGGSRGNLSAKP